MHLVSVIFVRGHALLKQPRQSENNLVMRHIPTYALLILAFFCSSPVHAQTSPLIKALASGEAVLLMRHALAPGSKEPANFNLAVCSTQRNLSAEGRAQAKRTGAWLRAQGIASAKVYTSAWCRCRDTAQLLGFGGVTKKPVLNALAKGKIQAKAQTAKLRALISKAKGGAVIMVTHKWNIAALTGITPGSGESVVVSTRGGNVLGRIPAR